jgi:hypothetical protein
MQRQTYRPSLRATAASAAKTLQAAIAHNMAATIPPMPVPDQVAAVQHSVQTQMYAEFLDMPAIDTSHLIQAHNAGIIQQMFMGQAVDSGVKMTDPLQVKEYGKKIEDCAKFMMDRIPGFDPYQNSNDAQQLFTNLQKISQMAASDSITVKADATSEIGASGPSAEGGNRPPFWRSGSKGWKGLGAVTGTGVLFGVMLITDHLAKDPMVPEDRLSGLLGLPEDKVKAMVADTHVGVTCSSRLRESDAEHIEAIREKTENIHAAVQEMLSGSKPDQILVQFAGSGQAAENDFGKLDAIVHIIPGVSVGKLTGANGASHLVVSIDGPGLLPGVLNGNLAGLLGTQPTPTGMAACANEVVKAIQGSRSSPEPLTVNVETFSRGGSAGAIYTQLNAENDGIRLGKVILFDPEQGPNVSRCDRRVEGYASLDVVRSGANEYFAGMPATQLIISDKQPQVHEHPVLTTHGGAKKCAGDMRDFQLMIMEADSGVISSHLEKNAKELNVAAVSEHVEESRYYLDRSEFTMRQAEQWFPGRMALCNSAARAEYALSAVQQVNEATVVHALTVAMNQAESYHHAPKGISR